jgi:hypothetical protein
MKKQRLATLILSLLLFAAVSLKLSEKDREVNFVGETDKYAQINAFMRNSLGESFPDIDEIGNYTIILNFFDNNNQQLDVRISISSAGTIRTNPENILQLNVDFLTLSSFTFTRSNKLDIGELKIRGLDVVATNCLVPKERLNYTITFRAINLLGPIEVLVAVDSIAQPIRTIFTDPNQCFPKDFIEIYESYFSNNPYLPEWLIEIFGLPDNKHEDEFNTNRI